MTVSNLNGTKFGSVICFDNGKMTLGERPFFVSGGLVYNEFLYIIDININKVKVYHWTKNHKKPISKLVRRVLPQIKDKEWKGSIRKNSAITIFDDKLICSVFNGAQKLEGELPSLITFGLDSYHQTNMFNVL